MKLWYQRLRRSSLNSTWSRIKLELKVLIFMDLASWLASLFPSLITNIAQLYTLICTSNSGYNILLTADFHLGLGFLYCSKFIRKKNQKSSSFVVVLIMTNEPYRKYSVHFRFIDWLTPTSKVILLSYSWCVVHFRQYSWSELERYHQYHTKDLR